MASSIRSRALGKITYKIIFLGDTAVGKTSIIERFVNGHFDDSQNPTIGIDFLGKTINFKGSQCRLQLWDTAGQEKFKSLIPSYLKDAICAIFVFDMSREATMTNLESWIKLYRDHHHPRSIALFCGNKSDLSIPVNKPALQALMEKYKMPYHCVSAKSGENVQELFMLILDMINMNLDQEARKAKRRSDLGALEGPLTVDRFIMKDSIQQQANQTVRLAQYQSENHGKSCTC